MSTIDLYTPEEITAVGLSAELVLAIAFVDDGNGNIARVWLTNRGATSLGSARLLGIVPAPENLCLIREGPANDDGHAAGEPIGLARLDVEGNLSVREPWAADTRESLAFHTELVRLRAP